MKNLILLLFLIIFGMSSCKQMNCADLISQRHRMIDNPSNIQQLQMTDSLIIKYCK